MSICKHTLLTNQRDIGMRKDALNTLTKLTNNCCHAFASLGKGSTMHIGLGGDTTHIQAGATYLRTFEDNHLQALLSGIFSGAVTTWARADDNQINLRH